MTATAPTETWHYVEQWAERRPDAEAIVFEDRRIRWRELKQAVDEMAQAFIAAGVGPGDCVAMLAMARPEFIVSYMAANKIGAVWVGLSPKYRLEELYGMLEGCRPVLLITLREYMGEDLAPLFSALGERLDGLQRVVVIGEPVPGTTACADFVGDMAPRGRDALAARAGGDRSDADALLIYTSGSTGKPKGVVHTHRNLLANVSVQVREWGLDCDTRVLLHFPINHAAASVVIGLATIVAGGCQVMMDRFDPVASLEMAARERLTVFGQAPAMFMLQLDHPLFNADTFRTVRRFIWAGAPAPLNMVERLAGICAETGATMLTGYGASETCGWITYTEPDADFAVLSQSAGKIAAPFELKLVTVDDRPASAGEIGEIRVRGPFMMKHYLGNPEATAAVMDPEGWYRTGDLARQDAAGNIYITGRTSEMFKSGGEIVYPREVELVLESDPAVLMAVVVSVDDPVYQQVGWAYVMPEPGRTVQAGDLDALCRRSLANFKVPKKILVRADLPLLANGKLDRKLLSAEARAAAEQQRGPA